MPSKKSQETANQPSVAELRRMPPEQRDAILDQQAAVAEEEYRTNPALTDFEAYGRDDLYGESTGSQTG